MVAGFAAFAAFALYGVTRSGLGRSRPALVQRDYHLTTDKADALYELILPPDIHVQISRSRAEGVFIRGTPTEANVVDRFVEIISRYDDLPPSRAKARVRQLESAWTTTREYRMTQAKAAALFRILDFDDVPVRVSKRGRRVTIRATSDDQAVIRSLVDILEGKRPRRLPAGPRSSRHSHLQACPS